MAVDDASLTTLHSRPLQASPTEPGVPALTIAFHTDTRRIGERALLADAERSVMISRKEPEFFGPGSPEGRALGERHLSRRGIVLTRTIGGVRLDCSQSPTALRLDGVTVDAEHLVDEARLEAGVVLELADHVVLVLHRSSRVALDPPLGGLVGVSDEMSRVRSELRSVALQPVPVLLLGESGVGKELAARAVHDLSARRRAPYVSLNMAAVVSSTAASELFGHEVGAFTGAARRHEGCFVEASGGTLFLDEIGATSLDVQAMLLRVLETGELRPVGARATRQVDVRIVAATDRNLEEATTSGEFRLPLLHRLAVYPITIPPLRQRRCDIGPLAIHFLRAELGEDAARLLDTAVEGTGGWLPAHVVARLVRFDWPGNVRELRNAICQLVIASRDDPRVTLTPSLERRLDPREPADDGSANPEKKGRVDLDALDEAQVLAALQKNRFKVAASARDLGISKQSLYLLMERSDSIRIAKDLTGDEIRAAREKCGGDVTAMAETLEVSKRGLRLRMTDLGIDVASAD